jgi:hypothetical protein
VVEHETVARRTAHAPAHLRRGIEHKDRPAGAMDLNRTHEAGYAGANNDDRGSLAGHAPEKW